MCASDGIKSFVYSNECEALAANLVVLYEIESPAVDLEPHTRCDTNPVIVTQDCTDDIDWTFTTKKGRVKTCNWVAKKTGKRCGKKGNDDTIARDACQAACSSC